MEGKVSLILYQNGAFTRQLLLFVAGIICANKYHKSSSAFPQLHISPVFNF